MIINHNLSAVNAHRNLMVNTFNTDVTMEALSSGLRINKGRDDAAGLAVSEKMRAQIRGLHQASRNAQDGISFVQTAEGHLQETTSALQRIRELSIQAANGIYTKEDRSQIQAEVTQLIDEVQRVAEQSTFNQMKILNGRFSESGIPSAPAATAPDSNAVTSVADPAKGLIVHVGANADENVQFIIDDMSAQALGIGTKDTEGQRLTKPTVSVETISGANQTIISMDQALEKVNKQRANLGAYQNRLEMAVKGIDVAAENIQSAESRIRDADMAKQMVEFVKNSILTQSATSMLAQANTRPQLALRILG